MLTGFGGTVTIGGVTLRINSWQLCPAGLPDDWLPPGRVTLDDVMAVLASRPRRWRLSRLVAIGAWERN